MQDGTDGTDGKIAGRKKDGEMKKRGPSRRALLEGLGIRPGHVEVVRAGIVRRMGRVG